MNLPSDIARFVAPDRAANLYLVRDHRRALLVEAKACVANKHLTAWVTESAALVDHLAAQLAGDEAKIEAFEAALPPLLKAVAEEEAARSDFALATHARAMGSLKRAEALRLRDDVEACEQVLRIRTREREACAAKAGAGLPTNVNIAPGPGRNTIESLASFVITRRFNPEASSGAIDRDVWNRWLEMSEGEFMWLPFHAAFEIKESRKGHTWIENSRRVAVVLPIDDFVAELVKFKGARTAHLKNKVTAAMASLETAKANAAALNVGGAA